ncbi:MAG: hypothetical protein WC333_01955 [Dehalococcoidia bacterium]|jgi:hypothetical protein
MKEKIQARIDEYQKELDKWKEQWRQIQDGELPMMPPFADMVNRHLAMYGYQIGELKWVLEQMNTPEETTKTPVS